MTRRHRIAIPLLTLALSGCAWLAPRYERPVFDLPPASGAAATQERLADWWSEYGDPVLEQLIERALAGNGDVVVAVARLEEARAQYDFTTSNRFPLLALAGGASRAKVQADSAGVTAVQSLPPALLQALPAPPGRPADVAYAAGLVSYEVDLWGKLANTNRAAQAAYRASVRGADAARLSIASAAAQLYFGLLALDASIEVTRDTIASRTEACELHQFQYDHEAVSGLVLRQSQAELAAAQAQLPALAARRDQAETALAVLLGYSPREIMEEALPRDRALDALAVPPLSPEAVSSDLLLRRPDVAAAEQALIASHCNIGAARAAYFPSISLSSLLGASNVDVQNLYSGPVRGWQLGAALAGPVLDFGRTSSGVDLAQARHRERLAIYCNSVRAAFKETKDALSAERHAAEVEKATADGEKASAEALDLANARYTAGYSSYIEVLDAQRMLYAARMARVAARLERLDASVNLYKALGGAWQARDR